MLLLVTGVPRALKDLRMLTAHISEPPSGPGQQGVTLTEPSYEWGTGSVWALDWAILSLHFNTESLRNADASCPTGTEGMELCQVWCQAEREPQALT